jgi:mRNA interferase MazF
MPPQVKDSGLAFHPHAGTYLMCDFHGCIEPEINKRRPVIVVTRVQFRSGLCMVVPTSTTEPKHLQPYHVRLSRNYHPNESDDLPVWAKCDLITNVSLARLDRFRLPGRRYETPRITDDDLRAVRAGVVAALGFPGLTIKT